MSQLSIRHDDLVWQEVEEEIVVLDLRASQYFRLNGSGAVLWRLLAEPRSLADLVATLTDTYGLSSEQARTDVENFVDQLTAQQMLEHG